MRKVYVMTMFDMDEESIVFLKEAVKESTGIEINPELHDFEGMNTGCVFEVEEQNEIAIVNAIHDLGDYECFMQEPEFDEESEQWIGSYSD